MSVLDKYYFCLLSSNQDFVANFDELLSTLSNFIASLCLTKLLRGGKLRQPWLMKYVRLEYHHVIRKWIMKS
jgi:hypothetical protein